MKQSLKRLHFVELFVLHVAGNVHLKTCRNDGLPASPYKLLASNINLNEPAAYLNSLDQAGWRVVGSAAGQLPRTMRTFNTPVRETSAGN